MGLNPLRNYIKNGENPVDSVRDMTTFLIASATSKIEEKTKFGGFQLSPHIMTLLYMGHVIVRRF